jgi:iron complex outermembrane recepter protein
VLIDGRTIYSPIFSGVVWDLQDTMLEDIDRIEVIRGPGATLWGANAVNGVINIITKNASETQGGIASFTAGNQIDGIASARYGAKIADDSYLRMYAKQTAYDSEFRKSGASAGDSWHKSQTGFRSDSKISENKNLNIQGDIYVIDQNMPYTIPDPTSGTLTKSINGNKSHGGNLTTRLEINHDLNSQTTIQAYVDSTNYKYKSNLFNDETNTIDLDVQNVWTGWQGQEIVWGGGYRLVNNTNDPSTTEYALTPKTRNDSLFNTFVQNKITLSPKELFLTVGSKFEHNNYTGVEVQPSARVAWLPSDEQTVWAAVSRAICTPYRYSDDANQLIAVLPGPLPVRLVGNPSLKSEEMIAYELGYRFRPIESLSFDAAAFYNDYDNLISSSFGTPSTFLPIISNNLDAARSIGGELSAEWAISNIWQVAGAYSYINLLFDKKDNVAFSFVGKTPRHQFNLRSTYLFPIGIEMTNALYYVDEMSVINIPGYYRFDTRISYPLTDKVELSLIGQNLLDDRHQEFTNFLFKSPAEIGRSVYASVAYKF